MKIPYLDLRVEDKNKKQALLDSVDTVLSHGRIVLGPEVSRFEDEIAGLCTTRFAVGVGSGTDALYLALRSLGIGPGDEVITTPLSWIATANAIALCGATPVFVDIDEDLNINVDLIPAAITDKTRAILPVHFTGKMCDMPRIIEIASAHPGVVVVEDAAQAFGAKLNGMPAGSFGTIGAFSMNPMKVLNAYGEAGVAVTNDADLNEKLISLRYAGTINKEDCHTPSINGRLDTIQAAMMLVELGYLDEKIARRREIARFYSEALKDVVACPEEPEGYFHVYYSYTIRSGKRDELKEFLASRGVETKIQHPILMPFHTAYRDKYASSNLPMARRVVGEILCIPNHEGMRDEEVEYVAACVREFSSGS